MISYLGGYLTAQVTKTATLEVIMEVISQEVDAIPPEITTQSGTIDKDFGSKSIIMSIIEML